jgi:molybdate transport system substrate-binding protein
MKIVRVLSGGAAQGLVEALRPSFEATTGAAIEGTFGAVGAMRDRLLAGEPADVMILSRALIDGLARDGQVLALSAKDIGAVQTAVAVRSGDSPPAVGSAAPLRGALLAADGIHFPDPEQSTAGIHFAKVLKDLGIWDEVADRRRPASNGATAMRELAAAMGSRAIGCTQATEILATPGIVLVASLPAGCDLATIYTCAIATKSPAPAEAAELIASLAGEAARESRRRLGFV